MLCLRDQQLCRKEGESLASNMKKIDIDKLKKKKNLFKTSGKPVITSVAMRTHRATGVCLGVYWYHVSSGRLLWAEGAGSYHLDPDLLKQDEELCRMIQRPLSREELYDVIDANPKQEAYEAGWISGRVGRYDGKTFAYIYRNKAYASRLTGADGAEFLMRLVDQTNIDIGYLLDGEGYDLVVQI